MSLSFFQHPLDPTPLLQPLRLRPNTDLIPPTSFHLSLPSPRVVSSWSSPLEKSVKAEMTLDNEDVSLNGQKKRKRGRPRKVPPEDRVKLGVHRSQQRKEARGAKATEVEDKENNFVPQSEDLVSQILAHQALP